MGDWPSFLDEAGPLPGLSGAADEARDRLVETFVKYNIVVGLQRWVYQNLAALWHAAPPEELEYIREADVF